MRKSEANVGSGMQTSPWLILGATMILLVVVLVLSFQNTARERRYMSRLLSAQGAALIRAVEAGARTGMMGMMWGGQQIQKLLEETARLPDVRYMAVIDQDGLTMAHSDPSKIGHPFDPRPPDHPPGTRRTRKLGTGHPGRRPAHLRSPSAFPAPDRRPG